MEENIESKQAPEPGTESGKTFTQEEVNNIVQQRLNREKGKADPVREAALVAKELELEQRELQLKAHELLVAKGLPKELSSIIRAEDEETLKKNIEILEKHIKTTNEVKNEKDNKKDNMIGGFHIGREDMSNGPTIRSLMGLPPNN